MEEGKNERYAFGRLIWIVFVAIGVVMSVFPIDDYFSQFSRFLQRPLADISSWFLNGLSIENTRTGFYTITVNSNMFSVDVASQCTGIRSVSALMVLSVIYSWTEKMKFLGGIVLAFLAVPIALVGNIVRISTVCMVGKWCGRDFAMGFYHDYSGYFIFMFDIVMLVVCAKVISRFIGKSK